MKNNFIKTLMTISIYVLGMVSLQAQSLEITHSGTSIVNYYCMDINDPGTTFSVDEADLAIPGVSIAHVDYTWTYQGGIVINSGAGTNSVSVVPEIGTDYAGQYSKYAKGKLVAKCRVKYAYTYPVEDCTTHVITNKLFEYYVDYSTEIEIRKTFSSLAGNAIVGPKCISPGTDVTFSVAPWVSQYMLSEVGIDSYTWDVPQGVNAGDKYYSADHSSITFTAGAQEGIEGKTIKVNMGACNSSTTQLPLELTLRQEIPTPVITPTSCLPGDIQEAYFSIQNPIAGVEYTWTVDENWEILNANNQKVSSFVTEMGEPVKIRTDKNNPATIYVEASYTGGTGCKSVSSTTRIKRRLDPAFSKITMSSLSSCFVPGDEVTFTLNNAPSPAQFNWDKPVGWNYKDPTDINKSIITLIPTATATGQGEVKVSADGCEPVYENGELVIDYSTIKVNLKPGDANPITISGASFCIDRNGEYTFSTTAVSPVAQSYNWVFGSGWTGISIAPDQLSATATATGDVIGTVTVTPLGTSVDCVGGTATAIVSYPPEKPVVQYTISGGKSCINTGLSDIVTLSVVTPKPGETYQWSYGNLGSGATTGSSINATTSGVEGAYNVFVTAQPTSSVCSSTTNKTSDPSQITIDGYDFTVQRSDFKGKYYYIINGTNGWNAGSMTYVWMLDGQQVTDLDYPRSTDEDLTSTYSDLLTSTSTHTFTVTITGANECTTTRVLGGPNGYNMVNQGLRSATAGISETQLTDVTIYPNPATNEVNISFSEGNATEITMIDMKGNIVEKLTTKESNATIDISDLVVGNYIITLSRDGKSISKQIIKK